MKAVAASKPSDVRVYLALARIESRLDRAHDALRSLRRAEELAPEDLDVLFELGAVYGVMRQKLEATRKLETFLAKSEGREDLEARRVEAQRIIQVMDGVI